MAQPKQTSDSATKATDTLRTKQTLTSTTATLTPLPTKEKETDYLSIFNAISPIVVLLIGLRINGIIEKDKEKKRLRKVEKYFFFSIPPLIESMQLQMDAIKYAITSIDSFNINTIRIAIVPSFHTAKLKGVSDTDIYTIFAAKRKATDENIANYLNISQTADLIEITKSIIQETNEEIMGAAKKFFEIWSTTVTQLSNRLKDSSGLGVREYVMSEEILTVFIRKRVLYINENGLEFDNLKIDTYYKNFIEHIYKLALETPGISTSSELYSAISTLHSQYNDLLFYRKNVKERLFTLVNNLSNSIFYMTQAVSQYNERQKKKAARAL